jgi:tRNA uridine 5-carboxymethylaminomethyl modification enzyme
LDDLISQGVDEPYRIFTSRAEHRLAMRYDNADERLAKYGRELGLVGDADWERFNARRDRLSELRFAVDNIRIKRGDERYANVALTLGSDLGDSFTVAQLARRPGVGPEMILPLLPLDIRSRIRDEELGTVLADSLYAGYIESQKATQSRINQHDQLRIPDSLDFRHVHGLSHEMTERLTRARPHTFGDARRIPGLTPAALSSLLVHLNSRRRAA